VKGGPKTGWIYGFLYCFLIFFLINVFYYHYSFDIRFQHHLFVFLFNVLWLQFLIHFMTLTLFQFLDIALTLVCGSFGWTLFLYCFLSWWWKRVITCFSLQPLTFFIKKNLLHCFNFVCFQLEVKKIVLHFVVCKTFVQTSFLCCFQVNDQKGGCCVFHLVSLSTFFLQKIFLHLFSTFFIFNFKLKNLFAFCCLWNICTNITSMLFLNQWLEKRLVRASSCFTFDILLT
jgi:hypothetical protein